MSAPPLPPEVQIVRDTAAAILADDKTVDAIAEAFADKHDSLRSDLRKYLRIPAGRDVSTNELSAMVGVQLLAANAVMEALVEQAQAKAARDGAA